MATTRPRTIAPLWPRRAGGAASVSVAVTGVSSRGGTAPAVAASMAVGAGGADVGVGGADVGVGMTRVAAGAAGYTVTVTSDGVAVGADVAMTSSCPTSMTLESSSWFRATMRSTVVWYCSAIVPKVSPLCTT